MAPVYGFQGQLGIDTANPTTKRFDFIESDLGVDEEFIDTNGLRGTRSRDVSRIRQGIRRIQGPIRFQPDAAELALLLPWILAGTTSGGPTVTYNLGDTLPGRFVQVDKGSKVMTYNGCAPDTATFHAVQGGPLEVTLNVIGIDETVGNSGTFPALTIDTANAPFVFTDLSLSIGGSTYQAKEFTLTVNNAIDRERFFNSQTLITVLGMDRHIGLTTSLPYGDAAAVYALGGASGTAVTATLTNGGAVLVFSLVKVCLPRRPIAVARPEVMVPIVGTAYKSAGTLELVTTLNPGP